MISMLAGGILVVVILIVLMNWNGREPVPQPYSQVPETPEKNVASSKLKQAPSSDVAETPASETTQGGLRLSRSQWREVQKALNDIGFDAGPNDGIPGAKTISAIALFQESRGFPPSGKLSEAQHGRLLADTHLAAEGRLLSEPDQADSSAMLRDMVEIPAGCFQMGSPSDEEGRDDDERWHRVCVEAFKIDRTEVTQQQWHEVMGANPSRFKGCDDCPVERVSWDDVQAFLHKLNTLSGQRFRLPTEAEWEYAARAGTSGPFSFQGKISADKVNYNASYTYAGSSKGQYREKTVPVGSLPANPWGLHEVHGNVREWTCSAYDENYGGSERQCAGSKDGGRRALRGGSWDSIPRYVRSANRYRGTPDVRNDYLGFRLAQD